MSRCMDSSYKYGGSRYDKYTYQKYIYNIEIGTNGCEHRFAKYFYQLGYKLHNEPNLIKIHHNHCSDLRNENSRKSMWNFYTDYFGIMPCLNNLY